MRVNHSGLGNPNDRPSRRRNVAIICVLALGVALAALLPRWHDNAARRAWRCAVLVPALVVVTLPEAFAAVIAVTFVAVPVATLAWLLTVTPLRAVTAERRSHAS